MTLKERTSGNIFGKGENAGSQHLLLLHICFLPFSKTEIVIFYSKIHLFIFNMILRTCNSYSSLPSQQRKNSTVKSNKMCLWNTNTPATAIFFKTCDWYFTLTLTDDLDLALPKEYKCEIWKLYPLAFKSYGQCTNFCRQTNGLAKNSMSPIYWCGG